MEMGCLAAVLLAMGVSIWSGWRRRDGVAFACGLMVVAAIGLMFSLYATSGFRGMRNLLFTWPMLALAVGAWAGGTVPAIKRSWIRPVLLGIFGVAAAVPSFSVARQMLALFAVLNKDDDALAALVESVHHDPKRMLASPVSMGLPYALRHHPVQWAFLPRNGATLSLLMKRYDVGTLIVPQGLSVMKHHQLLKIGFTLEHEMVWQQQKVRVYKRSSSGRLGSPAAVISPKSRPAKRPARPAKPK
jgi:hypothetical protein